MQRTDANVVPREDEPAVRLVPDGARKRPTETLEGVRTPAIVRVRDQFFIGARMEPVTLALERGSQLAGVGQM